MNHTEIVCIPCRAHQAMSFRTARRQPGERYCINSIALEFTANGEPLPDKLGPGAPEGEV
jgi:peptide-methionine (R)-S-oxide reductase